jgi:hypothetical protein
MEKQMNTPSKSHKIRKQPTDEQAAAAHEFVNIINRGAREAILLCAATLAGVQPSDVETALPFLLTKGFPMETASDGVRVKVYFEINELAWNLYGATWGKLVNERISNNEKGDPYEDPILRKSAQVLTAQFLIVRLKVFSREIRSLVRDSMVLAAGAVTTMLKGSPTLEKATIERLGAVTTRRRKRQSGVKRGRPVNTKLFWTDENKIRFYQKVTEIPKIGKKSLWLFIFDELIEGDFAHDTRDWLLRHPKIRDIVTPDLIELAAQEWRKYNYLREIRDVNFKPRMFDFRLALRQIGLSDEIPFNTLDTYFKQGRKLAAGLMHASRPGETDVKGT